MCFSQYVTEPFPLSPSIIKMNGYLLRECPGVGVSDGSRPENATIRRLRVQIRRKGQLRSKKHNEICMNVNAPSDKATI